MSERIVVANGVESAGTPLAPESQYLALLPAVFREVGDSRLLGGLLRAFEDILSGRGDPRAPGLEELLDGFEGDPHTGSMRYFVPGPDLADDGRRARGEFLDWLAGWVALSTREDWTDQEKRRLIGRVAALYRWRGTRAGLIGMLSEYLGFVRPPATAAEPPHAAGVGEQPITIEEYPDRPHFFSIKVRLSLTSSDQEVLQRTREIVRAIIEQEKPAHTWYSLKFTGVKTMQLRPRPGTKATPMLRIGVNTLLGSP